MRTGLRRCAVPLVLASALTLALAACDDKSNEYVAPPPPTVTVATPLEQPVTNYLELTGSTSAFQSVDLVARVEGYLEQINFEDGTFVEKDKLLFVIEQPPYEAKVAEDKAQVEQQQAVLTQTQSELERQQRLIKDKATSQANLEQAQANRDSAQAAVDQANAELALAQINLSYTEVTAPFDGRMGRHLVDEGNLVGSGTPTTLANIEQLHPIYVYFTLNEIDVLKVRSAMRGLGIDKPPVGKLPVYIGLQTDKGYPYKGTLDFVDSGLDTSTGVLELRALLENKDYSLFPGLFVRVRLPLGKPEPGLFVPDAAVGYDQAGHYVLVIGKDDKVEHRTVVLGTKQGSLRQIVSGLKADEKVVIDGLLKAVPGSSVTPTDGKITAAAQQDGSSQDSSSSEEGETHGTPKDDSTGDGTTGDGTTGDGTTGGGTTGDGAAGDGTAGDGAGGGEATGDDDTVDENDPVENDGSGDSNDSSEPIDGDSSQPSDQGDSEPSTDGGQQQ